ncbi:hypothetical protein TYRP_005285 [Tyrophagus putrescentiae]|nr:hypothetical protein TYRP_005285 [Tyrophagus putrescentiae]
MSGAGPLPQNGFNQMSSLADYAEDRSLVLCSTAGPLTRLITTVISLLLIFATTARLRTVPVDKVDNICSCACSPAHLNSFTASLPPLCAVVYAAVLRRECRRTLRRRLQLRPLLATRPRSSPATFACYRRR